MYANSITSQAETQGALLRVTEGIQDSSPPWLRSRLQMLTLPLFNYGTLGSSLNPLSLICKLELTQMITRRNTLVQRSPEYTLSEEGTLEGRTERCGRVTRCGRVFQTEEWGEGGYGVFEAGGVPEGLLGGAL